MGLQGGGRWDQQDAGCKDPQSLLSAPDNLPASGPQTLLPTLQPFSAMTSCSDCQTFAQAVASAGNAFPTLGKPTPSSSKHHIYRGTLSIRTRPGQPRDGLAAQLPGPRPFQPPPLPSLGCRLCLHGQKWQPELKPSHLCSRQQDGGWDKEERSHRVLTKLPFRNCP